MEAAGKRYIVYGSRKPAFRLWNLSDLHLLARGCAEKDLDRDIASIKNDPYSFWLGGGDYGEFIGRCDKRFDPSCVAPWVPVAKLGDLAHYTYEVVRTKFQPIAHKCFGLLMGNHEYKHLLHNEQQGLHDWLCQELRVPNLGYSCMFHLLFCRKPRQKRPELARQTPGSSKYHLDWSIKVFAAHGSGAAGTPGGKLNRLTRYMDDFAADLYFIGHVHDCLVRKQPVLDIDAHGTRLVSRERLGLVAGSYLKCYSQGTSSYGEQKGYRPTALGASIAEVLPESRAMRAAV